MKLSILLVAVFLSLGAVNVFAQRAPNLLADPGFEQWAGDPSSTNWGAFGNVMCGSITPRSQSFMVKIYGNFSGQTNASGIYQDFPADEGKRYEVSAYLRQNSDDHLAGDNQAWVKLEFFNADRSTRLVTFESPVKMDVKSPSKKYMFISTGPAVAPKGTAFARAVVLLQQSADNAPGAVLVDDVSLRLVP